MSGIWGVFFQFTMGACLLAASHAAASLPPEFLVDNDDELRLRLDDPEQVRRTTSLNWIDMAVEAHRKRAPRVLRVLLDPGHGGHDDGAVGHCLGRCNPLIEKDLALALAHMVRRELERAAKREAMRVEVRLTRENDEFLSLSERVVMANDWEADLFISIHGNSSPFRGARGFEVYFLDEATDRRAARLARLENEGAEEKLSPGVASILSDVKKNRHVVESAEFAESVFASMARKLKSSGRGVRQAPFKVLSGTEMPALLLEVGYLTNLKEAKALATEPFLRRLAGAISTGILEYAVKLRRFG